MDTVVRTYICYVQSTDLDHPRILLWKPRIRMQSSWVAQPKQLGHPWHQSHNRSCKQSSSAIRGKEAISIAHAEQLGHSRGDRGIVACRAKMHALSIDRRFTAMNGRGAWHVQSIVASLPQIVFPQIKCIM